MDKLLMEVRKLYSIEKTTNIKSIKLIGLISDIINDDIYSDEEKLKKVDNLILSSELVI